MSEANQCIQCGAGDLVNNVKVVDCDKKSMESRKHTELEISLGASGIIGQDKVAVCCSARVCYQWTNAFQRQV